MVSFTHRQIYPPEKEPLNALDRRLHQSQRYSGSGNEEERPNVLTVI